MSSENGAPVRVRAWTIVELLLAVAILAILAGLVMSVVARARTKGLQTSCASNLRQIAMASLMYAHDQDGVFPPYFNRYSGGGRVSGCFFDAEKEPEWWRDACSPTSLDAALSPYIRERSVMFCPTDMVAGTRVTQHSVDHQYSSYVYGFVGWMGLGIYVRTDSAGRMLLRKNRVISYAWDDVTETRLVMDANDSGLAACSGSPVPDAPPGCEHFGGINTVYLDGHVKWLPGCR